MAPKDNPNPHPDPLPAPRSPALLAVETGTQVAAVAGLAREIWTGVAGFGRPGIRAALLGLIGVALWVWLVAVQFRELPRNAWYRDALAVLLWGAGCLAAYRCARGRLARRPGRAVVSVHAGWSGRERVILVLGAGLVLFTLAALGHGSRFYFYSWPIGFRALAHWPRQVAWHFLLLSWGFVLLGVNPLPTRLLRRLLATLLVTGQLVCIVLLLRHTGFSAPYSDDHPSFLFRLAEYFGAFPWRENYVPYWNAGVVNSVITSSGVAGYALLGAPFWLLTEPHLAAPYALLFTFVLFVPWFTVFAFRAAGLSWTGALAGGLLMLCGSRLYFIWMLHFGTVGASLSGALLPAALAFLYAAVHRRPAPPRRVFAGLFLALFLMGQWPPMLLLGLPMGLLTAAAWRRWWRPAVRGRLLWTGLLVVGALLPTVAGALLGKTVMEHVLETPSGQGSCAARLWASFCSLTPGLLMDVNPLVLVAGAAGVWVMPWKRLRRWVVVVLLFLVLVFTAGPVCLPNMQLERMAIMAAGLLVLPAAAWLRVALEVPAPRLAAVRAAILALLVCSLANVARVYAGRTPAAYTGIRPSIRALAAWIREQVPADGRLLFAGPVVHAYGRGHIAYLPLLAGREMMAADYYGFPAGMVEPGYPPEAFRRQSGGMERFMRLHGVSHVITFRDNYLAHFRAHPADYEEVAVFREPLEQRHHVYTVFKVRESGGRFREGAGTVRAGFNRLTVSLDDPRAPQAVIAYNWDDRLSVAAPAQIAPVEVEPGVTFIGLRPNGARMIDIRYRSRF